MNALIDTSSLLAFVRYYLPFDASEKLKNLIGTKIEDGELLVLDKVVEEAGYLAKGIILTELDFLTASSKLIDTRSLLPTRKFFNLLENQFCNKSVVKMKNLTDTEFEVEKTRYLEDADAKLLLYAVVNKSEGLMIITEETSSSNDNKVFRKIPDSCNAIDVECCTLPTFFNEHLGIDLAALLKG